MARLLLRAPDHLGDGVMAIPAIRALGALGPCRVDGPSWSARLYASIDDGSPSENADVAVLFKPSLSAAWRVRRIARRIGLSWDFRRWLLTDPVHVNASEHRVDEYRRIAETAGAQVTELPSLVPTAEERDQAPEIPTDAVLLLPLTRSTATVAWRGFRALADSLNGRAVFAAGPGEDDALTAIAGPHPTLSALDIGTFAAVASRVTAVVGNDSGLTHLAAAARRGSGMNPRDVHVIYGSTDPARTGPPGTTPHRLAPLPCYPCYRKRCTLDARAPCLEVPASTIAAALVIP